MNYTALVSNIQNFIEDDSTELSNSIPTIITQAERMIFSRLPSLPCFRQSTTGTLAVGTADYTVASARMIRQVSVTSSSNVVYLDHRIDSYLRDYWPNSSTTGTPRIYSTKNAGTSGTVITLAPTPSATLSYQVDFIAPETGLSSTNANSKIIIVYNTNEYATNIITTFRRRTNFYYYCRKTTGNCREQLISL